MDQQSQAFFDMALVSILSFQFHPANHALQLTQESKTALVQQAIDIATIALHERNIVLGESRWLG